MLYLYDIWVNWFKGEKKGYNVCQFHEWRKDDKIEILDQVPFLYITDSLFYSLENNLESIPCRLLKMIYKRAYIRKNQKREPILYACIVSNGKDVLVIDTDGYDKPVKKSRLIPRQEKQAFELIKRAKQYSFSLPKMDRPKKEKITQIDEAYMVGLTRRERTLKQLMMMSLEQLQESNNKEELQYWLTEWQPHLFHDIKQMSNDRIWHSLYEGVLNGWSEKHESLCRQMIKGQPALEKVWQKEQIKESNAPHIK